MVVISVILFAVTLTRPMERVSSMEPSESRTVYDACATALCFETPLEIDYASRPYRLVPGCCELPRVSADGLEYRFAVRGSSGVTVSNVVAAIRRLMDPVEVSPNGWMVKDVAAVTGVGNDVVIRLRRRCHYFSWLMAMPAMGVKSSDGAATADYRLESWWKNHEMVFARRRGREGCFDQIRYLVIDDPSTRWLMFLKGEIDILSDLSRDNWDAITGDPEFRAMLKEAPSLDVIYVGFNMKDSVLGPNRALRRALNAAFDYPAWERFNSGRITRCSSPVPPTVAGHLATPYADEFNLERARRLMREAGYPDGIDAKTGRRLTLTMTIGRPSQESREAGELMASFYEKIGVKLELDFYTWDAFLKAVNDGRVQMYRMGWVGDYPDAQNFLQLFHSKNMSPGPNHSFYSKPEFDREYEAALAATSEETRLEHWRRCQEILREDPPWIFTHFNKVQILVRPSVGNYIPSCLPYGNEKWYNTRK